MNIFEVFMKLILLMITLGYSFNLTASFHMENRQGGGNGRGYSSSHPNKASTGEVYKLKPAYEKPSDSYHDVTPPDGMSMAKYQQMRAHYLKQVKYVDSQIDNARQEIERYEDYEVRSDLLDVSNVALKHAHECFSYHTYDYGLDYLAIAETALDLAISMTPVIGWARDVYETLTGKDALTGAKLSRLEHTFAIVGAVSGGLGSKLKAPFEMIGHIIKGDGLYSKYVTKYAEKLYKANSTKTIEEIHTFLRKNKEHIPEALHASFEKAFAHPTRVTVTKKDAKVFRYHAPDGNPRGQWVTTVKYDNPAEALALPGKVKPDPKEWILPKGTEVLEGRVSPQIQWGSKGGGYQIFVPNPAVLK